MKQKLFENIIWWEAVIDFWADWAQNLEKKENIFQVADFDYTLFSRDDQMEKIPELKENRGNLWPKYLFEQHGMMKFLKEHYENIVFPTDILDKFDDSRDIIITQGGSTDFQISKIRSMKQLDNYRVIVTPNPESKIPELIRYVLFELRYIPSEIIIYEDRPQYFIEHRELIEWILGCNLTIMFVEMDGNKGYKKIEEVK